jgi:hypothetical protein
MALLRAQIASRRKLHRGDTRKNPPECLPGEADESDTDSPKVKKGPVKTGPFGWGERRGATVVRSKNSGAAPPAGTPAVSVARVGREIELRRHTEADGDVLTAQEGGRQRGGR